MVFLTEQALKESYANSLREQGQGVSLDIPVGESGATIDILTREEIIVCKLTLDQKSAVEAKSQLDFYGQFSSKWEKAIAVQTIADERQVTWLRKSGIRVVVVSPGVVNQMDVRPADKPRFIYSRAYDYKKFEGGEGRLIALGAIALVFLLSVFGVIALNLQSQDASQRVSPEL